jgi:hypothetical protein
MSDQEIVVRSMASACLVAFALAEIISCVETWPRRLPSSEETRQELANRLTSRMRRLTRATGWMTVGLVDVLGPASLVPRLPVLVALVPLGWSMVDAPQTARGVDSAWLQRVKFAAAVARSMTAVVGAASLVGGILDSSSWWLFAAGALLLAGAQAHALVARAADEVLQLASRSAAISA